MLTPKEDQRLKELETKDGDLTDDEVEEADALADKAYEDA